MTADEIVETITAGNIAALKKMGVTPTKTIVDMLNMASMRGFDFGANMVMSAIQGNLAVKLLSLPKKIPE